MMHINVGGGGRRRLIKALMRLNPVLRGLEELIGAAQLPAYSLMLDIEERKPDSEPAIVFDKDNIFQVSIGVGDPFILSDKDLLEVISGNIGAVIRMSPLDPKSKAEVLDLFMTWRRQNSGDK